MDADGIPQQRGVCMAPRTRQPDGRTRSDPIPLTQCLKGALPTHTRQVRIREVGRAGAVGQRERVRGGDGRAQPAVDGNKGLRV